MGNEIEKRRPEMIGTYTAASEINGRFRRALEAAHLVSPSTSVGSLPEGCEIAISQIFADVENETYDVGGKRALSKVVLERIAAALGLSWDGIASGRLDDASDHHYCHWRAVGTYRAFDGQRQAIVAEKEMDLRDGSAQIDALWQRYEAKRRTDPRVRSPENQIREMRLHIAAHAETKARLRAVRSLGIRTAYKREELSRPFIVARIMFTGRTDDPELRRTFSEMTASSFLGARQALYGPQPAASAARAAPAPRLPPPPPVGTVPVSVDDYGADPAPPIDAVSSPADAGGARAAAFTIPGGRAKGTPISDAEATDLEYWAKRLGADLDAGSSRFPDRDRRLHAAILSELSKRGS